MQQLQRLKTDAPDLSKVVLTEGGKCRARRGKPGHCQTKQNKTKQNKTKQNETKQRGRGHVMENIGNDGWRLGLTLGLGLGSRLYGSRFELRVRVRVVMVRVRVRFKVRV